MASVQHPSKPRRSSAQQSLSDSHVPPRGGQRRIDLNEFCTSAEAAQRYRFKHARRFVEWANLRDVPFEWYGGRKLYKWSDLEALREPGNAFVVTRRAAL